MPRIVKLIPIVVILIVFFLPIWLAKRFGKLTWRDRLSCWCYRALLYVMGIKVTVHGHPGMVRPLLAVSNHLSYTDVCVLGSAFPFRFTPKLEIASWPVISAYCRATDAVFVDRSPDKLADAARDIKQSLSAGQVVCLFPEATTGNGVHLLPFKSGFFQLAAESIDGRDLSVQPVAIAYTRIQNLPIGSSQWPGIAWYGDMDLAPHLWELLKLGRIDAELHFLAPATMKEHGDRKRLAAHCRQAIAEAIAAARELPKKPVKTAKLPLGNLFRKHQ